jgi:hypothetical protein
MYAMDSCWWQVYGQDVQNNFKGDKYTYTDGVKQARRARLPRVYNSGAGAILLAQELGAAEVVLLGYDGGKSNGKAHWHKDHPNGLGNAGVSDKWPEQFNQLRALLKVPVVNCSRTTAITAFRRNSLEDTLWQTRFSES